MGEAGRQMAAGRRWTKADTLAEEAGWSPECLAVTEEA